MKFLVTLFLLVGSMNLIAQNDYELVEKTVSKDIIKSHIYFLASDELKGRQTGSHEGNVAALYLANQLKKYGVQPISGAEKGYFQPVMIRKTTAPTSFSLTINGSTSDKLLIIKGANINRQAEMVFLNHGEEKDYEGVDVKGKWVLVRAGLSEEDNARSSIMQGRTKRKVAKEMGALGLIEISLEDDKTWRSLGFYFNRSKTVMGEQDDFVHCWVQHASADFLEIAHSGQSLGATLSITGIVNSELPSQNVVGMVEGTDSLLKDEFIIYSAHYDHVGTGKPDNLQDSVFNGARDNAVGTVTVLSMAENLAKYPTKRSALFILFTGEEMGLLGSQYYVDHPLLPLEDMVFCFNSDNGGYNDKSLATIIGLTRTTAERNIVDAAKMAGLRAIEDPAPEQNLFDRSDNVHFAVKGIPAPTYSLGFRAFDAEINRFYHQRTDQADNLDYDYLHKFFLSYVYSGRKIANDPETPFWVKGDKYYEAGLKLYGREK
ncbi:MAG: M28 family peptidase [Bacteroidota bacterium]